MTPGASRHTHALDATIEAAIIPYLFSPHQVGNAVADVRNALLAEGTIVSNGAYYVRRGESALCIDLIDSESAS